MKAIKFNTKKEAEKMMDEIIKNFGGQIECDGKILQMVNNTELIQLSKVDEYDNDCKEYEIKISNNYENRGEDIYNFVINL